MAFKPANQLRIRQMFQYRPKRDRPVFPIAEIMIQKGAVDDGDALGARLGQGRSGNVHAFAPVTAELIQAIKEPAGRTPDIEHRPLGAPTAKEAQFPSKAHRRVIAPQFIGSQIIILPEPIVKAARHQIARYRIGIVHSALPAAVDPQFALFPNPASLAAAAPRTGPSRQGAVAAGGLFPCSTQKRPSLAADDSRRAPPSRLESGAIIRGRGNPSGW